MFIVNGYLDYQGCSCLGNRIHFFHTFHMHANLNEKHAVKFAYDERSSHVKGMKQIWEKMKVTHMQIRLIRVASYTSLRVKSKPAPEGSQPLQRPMIGKFRLPLYLKIC